jgi:transposase-like protein
VDEARLLDIICQGLSIGSRVNREVHARFWERLGVRVPRATRQVFIRIQGVQQYLWRAVDQNGVVLDILVQARRDGNAAKRFFRRLLKGLQYVPRVIVTDKLRSYGVARRQLLPGVEHRQSRYLNNRARTHIDRRDDESGRCNGSNRPNKRRTFSPLIRASTVTSVHVGTNLQPMPIV